MYFNAQCLTNKIDDLIFLTSNNDFDIILVTETWIDQNFNPALLNSIPYQPFYCIRTGRIHGGCLALISPNISTSFISENSFGGGYIESLWLKIKVRDSVLKLCLAYRSPDSDSISDDLFIDQIYNNCDTTDIILAGDFNLPHFHDRNPSPTDRKYIEVFSSCGLVQMIQKPTRENNILDFVLCTDSNFITNIDVVEPFSTSDHNKILFSLNVRSPVNMKQTRFFSDYKRADYVSLCGFLDTIDWDGLFNDCICINDMWNLFVHIISFACSLFVPLIKIREKPPFKFSRSTRNIYKRKLKSWRRYKLTRCPLDKARYNGIARLAKQSCFNDIKVKELSVLRSGNLKLFYSYVNSKMSSRNLIPALSSRDSIVCDSKGKAQLFQNHFSSVFTRDDGLLPDFPWQTDAKLDSVTINERAVLSARLAEFLNPNPDPGQI